MERMSLAAQHEKRMADIEKRRIRRESRGAKWGTVVVMTTVCVLGGCAAWWAYDTYKIFLMRVVAGVFIAAYGLWCGNGQAIPRPLGTFLEVPLLCACTWVAAHVLINPPEKLTSFRAVLLVGHPDPDHPDNQLPGTQETFCHLLGLLIAVANCGVLSWRLIFGTRNRKRSKRD